MDVQMDEIAGHVVVFRVCGYGFHSLKDSRIIALGDVNRPPDSVGLAAETSWYIGGRAMPELPEVETVVRGLREPLIGGGYCRCAGLGGDDSFSQPG